VRFTAYDTSGAVLFGSNSPTSLYWQIASDTGAFVANKSITTSSFNWDDSQWHCAVFRSTNTLATMHADGVQIGSAASPTSITKASRNFGIGNWRASPLGFFELIGNIAAVYVYDRPITNDEISQHAGDVFAPLRQRDTRSQIMFPEQAGGGGGGFQAAWASRATQVNGVYV
jgi:hypothetical protein